jgi:enolase
MTPVSFCVKDLSANDSLGSGENHGRNSPQLDRYLHSVAVNKEAGRFGPSTTVAVSFCYDHLAAIVKEGKNA